MIVVYCRMMTPKSWAPTPQNGQTHSNHFVGLALKGLPNNIQKANC